MQKSISVFLISSTIINDGQFGASLFTLGTKDYIFFATAINHYCAGVDGLGVDPASTWFLIPKDCWNDCI